VKRKIAAIFAADVVGYSRLVREDEEDALHRLDRCRAVFKEFIDRFGGRVVDMAGDSILAEFPTAIDAVRCAIDTQESLRTRNLDRPSERNMSFRIGISMGDVLDREGFLLGDGVNVASRLQAIAPSGGICISRSVHEAVAHKITLKFADAGQQQLKNIPDRVHAYIAALDQQERKGESLPQAPSIRRAVWGALGVVIIAALATGGYFLWNVKNEAGSAGDEHVAADVEKCTKPDVYKDEAIAACTRLLGRERTNSTDAAAYYTNRGGALLTRGDYELALKDLNEAVRLNPNLAVALTMRGKTLEALDRKEEAVTDFKRALAIDGSIEDAQEGLERLEQNAPW
jgi:class 3 adenylate cyclase